MAQHTTPRPSHWRRVATLLSAVAVAAGLLTVAPTAAAAAPPAGMGEVRAVVEDRATGAPVADALVELEPRGQGGPIESGRTDATGVVTIAAAPGDYAALVTAEGYASAYSPGVYEDLEVANVMVFEGGTAFATTRLDRGGSATVAVTAGGQPVEGALVELARQDQEGFQGWWRSCETDESGTCTVANLAPGAYRIVAQQWWAYDPAWGSGAWPSRSGVEWIADGQHVEASIALSPTELVTGTLDLDFEHETTEVAAYVTAVYADGPQPEHGQSQLIHAAPGDVVPFQLPVDVDRPFRIELEGYDARDGVGGKLLVTEQWTPSGMAPVGAVITLQEGAPRTISLTAQLGRTLEGTISIEQVSAPAQGDRAAADPRAASAAADRLARADAARDRDRAGAAPDAAADAGCAGACGAVIVEVWREIDGVWQWTDSLRAGDDRVFGTAQDFRVPALGDGTYALGFWADDVCYEFWEDAPYIDVATSVHVTRAGALPTIAAQLETMGGGCSFEGPTELPTPERVAGANRFGTSVEISQRSFPRTADVVYLASGTNYPDGLAAGPAAAHEGGPVLLTPRNAVPDVVLAEIRRLQPSKVVIVGGAPSVSAAAEAQVRALDPKREVVRLGGGNRFETSRLIAEHAFGETGAPGAFVATGLKFPDALAAGPAASLLGGPVLLVNGTVAAPDAATLATLDELGVQELGIAGDARSVSTGIETGIRGRGIVVERFAGGNRFETAAAISELFGWADTVHVASGEGFADALPGAAAAGTAGGPLLLSRGSCMPAITHEALEWFMPYDVVLLGGTPTLSANVASYGLCR